MSRLFNVGGPCIPTKHYMLPAAERLPEVMSLIRKEQYFVVHAQRQCGKTTAFRALMEDINARGERAALYCSVEAVQEFTDPAVGLPEIAQQIRFNVGFHPGLFGRDARQLLGEVIASSAHTSVIQDVLSWLCERAGKPLVVFFDEVDCLSEGTLISFLRQLRNGRIACVQPGTFPVSIALIGLRNIRDYRMRVRPDSQSTGEASPFNVITKALTLQLFTEEEMRALYRQHTGETGQVFEEEALLKAWDYSRGQPWLVNALARWCVEEIHHEDFSQAVTGEDMAVAREQLIRERNPHLDSLMEKAREPRIKPLVIKVMTGEELDDAIDEDNVTYALELGLFIEERGALKPANPIYQETLGRYLSRETQKKVLRTVPGTPWVKEDGLDMQGLLEAFQQFWRENATPEAGLAQQFHEAYPHLVLQAFLQRVVNGGGQIIREMALGRMSLDLGVRFRGATYAIEVKTLALYEKSRVKAYGQLCRYMDALGVSEGWLVVADPDLSKPWEGKLSTEELKHEGRALHIVRC